MGRGTCLDAKQLGNRSWLLLLGHDGVELSTVGVKHQLTFSSHILNLKNTTAVKVATGHFHFHRRRTKLGMDGTVGILDMGWYIWYVGQHILYNE